MRLNGVNFRIEGTDEIDVHRMASGDIAVHVETSAAMFATPEIWAKLVRAVREELAYDLPLEASCDS